MQVNQTVTVKHMLANKHLNQGSKSALVTKVSTTGLRVTVNCEGTTIAFSRSPDSVNYYAADSMGNWKMLTLVK